MKIPGLHHLIAQKRAAAGAAAQQALDVASPVTRGEMDAAVNRMVAEAERLSEHLHGNEKLIEGLMPLMHYAGTSKHKSDTRKEALAHLKAAAGLLLLEIGTEEPERDFEILPPEPPINGHQGTSNIER